MTFHNPYTLTPEEQAQVDAWEAMSPDDRGEYLHRIKQEINIKDSAAKSRLWDWANDHNTQRLADGGTQLGGQLRSDALMKVEGVEMTAKQAVDLGLRSSLSIGQHIADLG